MQQALRLAEQGLGECWPNPSVGVVIVATDGQVVGLGRTQKGGRPHAETEALAMAGNATKGATLYVTLEPCNHHGQTPPCVEAVIAAGIRKVVVACADPHAKASGGIARLREAGLEVVMGIEEQAAVALQCGFFSVLARKRPWVMLKTATSADGYIVTAEGESRWITGEAARQHGQMQRSRYDAILTGSGTVLADDPLLTCRIAGLEHRSPIRVVLDRRGRVSESAKILADGGPEVWRYDAPLPEVLADLAQRGITRLMVEAGGNISGAMLAAGLVDELYWYRAPVILGQGSAPAFNAALSGALAARPSAQLIETRAIGCDSLSIYRLTDPQGLYKPQ